MFDYCLVNAFAESVFIVNLRGRREGVLLVGWGGAGRAVEDGEGDRRGGGDRDCKVTEVVLRSQTRFSIRKMTLARQTIHHFSILFSKSNGDIKHLVNENEALPNPRGEVAQRRLTSSCDRSALPNFKIPAFRCCQQR